MAAGGFGTAVLGFFAGSGGGNPLSNLVGQGANMIAPTQILTVDQAVECLHSGAFTYDGLNDILRRHGFQTTEFTFAHPRLFTQVEGDGLSSYSDADFTSLYNLSEVYIKSKVPVPTIQETLFLFNRQLITQELANVFLLKNTGQDPAMSKSWLESRYEIPGPSDLIRFAVREAFTPAIVQQYGYHKELPSAILPWLEKQGYGQPVGFNLPPGATDQNGNPLDRQAYWFDLYWWSHWELPSITQGQNMMFRLYDDSDYGPSPDWGPGRTFLEPDLETLMKVQDIPEYWRSKLVAISYNPLTRVDVRRMHEMGVLDNAGVYHAYRAIGYNDANAKNLLAFTERLTLRDHVGRWHKGLVRNVCEQVVLGIVDWQTAEINLQNLGFTVNESSGLISQCRIDYENKVIKEQIQHIRRAFLNGVITKADAKQYLDGLGVDAAKATDFTDRWDLQLLWGRKEVSIKKALELYCDRIIDRNELLTILQNLNLRPIRIHQLAQQGDWCIQQKINKFNAANQAAIAKQIKDAQAKADKLAKQLIAAKKQADAIALKKLQAYLKPYTDANIKLWHACGTLTTKQVIAVLKMKGWNIPAITNFINVQLANPDPNICQPGQQPIATQPTTETAVQTEIESNEATQETEKPIEKGTPG
jgi:hypothetical protein